MPKLSLDLDQIRVETFSTGAAELGPAMIPTTRTQEPTCTCQATFCPGIC
jgi:hypothetical protein